MNKIETCFSPALLPHFGYKNSAVVVIDILRATSSICVAFANGAKTVIPVETLEECKWFQDKGFLAAAERGGEKIEGFDFGNSPFSFRDEKIRGKEIVFSTTNGTRAIKATADAALVIICSFVNLEILCEYLCEKQLDILCMCAGWKNKFNLEDSLFAGAVTRKLIKSGKFITECDSSKAAMQLYDNASNDLFSFLENSSHRIRLKKLNIDEDVRFCLDPDSSNVLPILSGDRLTDYYPEFSKLNERV